MQEQEREDKMNEENHNQAVSKPEDIIKSKAENKKNIVKKGSVKNKNIDNPMLREYVRPTKRVPSVQRDRTVFPEHIEKLPHKHYCWAMEADIQDRINAWYDFVKDIHGNRVQMVANKSLALGDIKRNQYLMMCDEKYWIEDFNKEQQGIINLDRKKMTLQAGQYKPEKE